MMTERPQDPLFEQLAKAKQELIEMQKQYPVDDDGVLDGYWDEIERIWYEIIDHYDTADLERWGISPV